MDLAPEWVKEWGKSMIAPLFTPKVSQIKEGVLTPEEFVQAGDELCYKFGTWQWCSGIPEKRSTYLPPDKQYLLTKNVPCEITSTHHPSNERKIEEDTFWEISDCNANVSISDLKSSDDDDDDALDLAEIGKVEASIVKTRRYDISITYDHYYGTPKMWLFGYGPNNEPLTPEQVFEDINPSHAKKTVTSGTHPYTNVESAYIHPCKHAEVMKAFIKNMEDNKKEFTVRQYLLLFLKLMSIVMPNIHYDNTIDVFGGFPEQSDIQNEKPN